MAETVARPLTLVLLCAALSACAAVPRAHAARDPVQRAAFMRTHPCPANGATRGSCPGWVVDHIVPLCVGGADDPSNMQWQDAKAAREKDAAERQQCVAGR